MLDAADPDELTDDEYDARLIIEYLQFQAASPSPAFDFGPPGSAKADGSLAQDNQEAQKIARADPRYPAPAEPAGSASRGLTWDEMAFRFDPGRHPRDAHGRGAPVPASRGLVLEEPVIERKFNPGQQRDWHGRWGSGGGRPAAAAPSAAVPMGGAVDSLAAHTLPDGKLDPAREALHQRIVAEALAHHQPKEHPTALFLGGGTASGKSTLGGGDPGSVAIDADAVKAKIPEYKQMLAAHNPKAAAYAHEESSAVAKEIQAGAIKNHFDFTLDGTGDGAYAKMEGKIKAAQAAGYKVSGKYVTVDTETAIERSMKRAEQTGRMVPEPVIREIHAAVSDVFGKVIANDLLDSAELWDTNGPKPVLVGSKPDGGKWTVHDQKAWNKFLAKAKT